MLFADDFHNKTPSRPQSSSAGVNSALVVALLPHAARQMGNKATARRASQQTNCRHSSCADAGRHQTMGELFKGTFEVVLVLMQHMKTLKCFGNLFTSIGLFTKNLFFGINLLRFLSFLPNGSYCGFLGLLLPAEWEFLDEG